MSNLGQRILTIRRAIANCRSTPGRRGRLVLLSDDVEDVLVAGDMHGQIEFFRRVMMKADLGNRPRRHLVMQELVHGPFRYPSGGDRSHQLVDLACALINQFPGRVHYLAGNHELAQQTNRKIAKHDSDPNEEFRAGVRTAYGNGAEEVYAAYMELFAALPLAVRTAGGTFFSHSLPSFGLLPDWKLSSLERDTTPDVDLMPGGDVYSLVWGRDLRGQTSAAFLEKVGGNFLITGHVPVEGGFAFASERHLVIDTQNSPAACALIHAGRPMTAEDLSSCVSLL
jgi:hypothetical protein